ncbi:MAG: type II toxin-antitoxin system PemK/MazF family toxin [Armatimonadetes bacterium]|nr:type II toxin-antitoxin system PemK/MazF family toxin [Armatimonadota bacterium]
MFTTIMTVPKPACKRGDVVLVLFPNSNLRTAKTRPALIVQANDLQTGLSQVIIAMISSQMSRANHPSRVTIIQASPEGLQSGLLSDSVVMADNLATVVDSAMHRVIGSVAMEEVDSALRHTLGLRVAARNANL